MTLVLSCIGVAVHPLTRAASSDTEGFVKSVLGSEIRALRALRGEHGFHTDAQGFLSVILGFLPGAK